MKERRGGPQTVERVTDPVCGMQVGADSDFFSYYKGKTYYFCSPQDKEIFDRDPEDYVLGGKMGTGGPETGKI